MEFGSPQFWVAVLQIIAIDILLGGDNAVVIALACRNLPEKQRKLGIFWGVFGAIALRVGLTIFAVTLLVIPFLKIIGAILLFWIGLKLVMPQNGGGEHDIDGSISLMGAIRTIIVADFVMSLDNVIAVAAAAKDSIGLIVFGLLVSIPIIVWCSQIILKLMERFPVIILLGGGLLGYIAGDMFVRDPILIEWVEANVPWLKTYHVAGFVCAIIVMAAGKIIATRAARAEAERGVVDLAIDEKK
ncbi:MAG: TerC family protein [Acidobacteria bacterium]|nr:TerC family protein [Acidobacteriota bacterium]